MLLCGSKLPDAEMRVVTRYSRREYAGMIRYHTETMYVKDPPERDGVPDVEDIRTRAAGFIRQQQRDPNNFFVVWQRIEIKDRITGRWITL